MTALRIRDEGGPRLCGQLLFYPVTDFPEPLTSTHEAFATGYGLTLDALRWFWSQYLPEPSLADDPRASPMRADSFADLPPALILTAEYDVLRDEGERYFECLRNAGVDAQLQRCEGMNHGFLKFAGIIDEASARMDQASAWLRRYLFGDSLIGACAPAVGKPTRSGRKPTRTARPRSPRTLEDQEPRDGRLAPR